MPAFLRMPRGPLPENLTRPAGPSFTDRAAGKIGSVISATFEQWELASRRGLLQSMDSRVKLVCLIFLLVVGTVKNGIAPGMSLMGGLFLLVCLSRLNPLRFYRRIFVLAFLFGFLVVLPASLNIVTGGEVVLPLFRFREAHTFWLYTIPPTVGITREGISVVGLVTLRMVNCLSVCFLLLYTTSLPQIIRSLRVFRVPDMLCVLFVLTYKYIFIFSKMVVAIHLARKSRSAGRLEGPEAGNWAAGRIAFLFRRTQARCEEVFQAMLSRGLAGNVALGPSAAPGRLDLLRGISLILFGMVLLWV